MNYKTISALIILPFVFCSACRSGYSGQPEHKIQTDRKLLAKYPVKYEIDYEGIISGGSFFLFPDGSGIVMRHYDKDVDDRSEDHWQYIQVNDTLYGPYNYIASGLFHENMGFIFTYSKKYPVGRACYYGSSCCVCGFFCLNVFFSSRGSEPEFLKKIGKHKGILDYLNVNGDKYGPYEYVGSISLSKKGKSYAFKYNDDNKKYFILNGKKIGPFEARGRDWDDFIAVSPDGKRYAYQIVTKARSSSDHCSYSDVILDGKKLGNFCNVKHISFSDNSRNFAFIFNENKIWNNGKVSGYSGKKLKESKYPSKNLYSNQLFPVTKSKEKPKFSIKEKTVSDEKYVIYRNNKKKKVFGPYSKHTLINSAISSDGKKFAYRYTKFIGRERLFVYYLNIGEVILGPFPAADVVITEDDRVIIAYIKDEEIHIEEIDYHYLTKQ